MSSPSGNGPGLLERSLESGRIHSAYLVTGPGSAPREAALAFVRGLVCRGESPPCEECVGCRRTSPREEIVIDGTGRRGPLLRHVGDHPDLLWIERGPDDTRVRIGQIRALQNALRLRSTESGRRAAVIADAEWLNVEAQNALLRLLEEPPPDTTLVLVTTTASGLIATVRSRCQRVTFRSEEIDPLDDPEFGELVARLEGVGRATVPDLLDWAAEFRGARAVVAAEVQTFLAVASAWLRRRVETRVQTPGDDVRGELAAFTTLSRCRKGLAQRNANPQMVAERALIALHQVATR